MSGREYVVDPATRISLLERALAEYAARYGLTERARALFSLPYEEERASPETSDLVRTPHVP